jgi:RimJ/RimL family protein N-acetyltransferase
MLLRRPLVEGLDAIELGYAFRPQYWGRGLATEATGALLRIAFETLGEPEAVAITGPQNAASRRVMEKNGLTYRRDFLFREQETVLYGITKAQWQSKFTSPQV